MATHHIKCYNYFFNLIASGLKTSEVRKNDRDYKVGDIIILQDYYSSAEFISGRTIMIEATHILNGGQFGILPEYCVISFKIISNDTKEKESSK